MTDSHLVCLKDPLRFKALCWPDLKFYDKQVEIIESVLANDETIVPAGNQLGKDFIAAFIVLWFFCSRSPCRVVTSSVDQDQLRGVLWGEIRRFVTTSRFKLPLLVNDLMIRQVKPDGTLEPLSYLIGRVAKKGEGLLGHHIARTENNLPMTLYVNDESSGADDEAWDVTDTWAHRKLAIGNPFPCQNFFNKLTKLGDLKSKEEGRFYRKIIRIKAQDSPNVRFAEAQVKAGQKPTDEILIPGVKSYRDYLKHREVWDPIKQCISLDAQFYEGSEVLLFPPTWLDRAHKIARELRGKNRKGSAMGVDSGEGGDSSAWATIDEFGLFNLLSKKTQDTNDIPGITLNRMKRYEVDPRDVLFDRGGGGKQHADRLRAQGYKVRTVGFGEAASDPHMYNRFKSRAERSHEVEERYVYKNRRAEMYGLLRNLLDPEINPQGFGLPEEYTELRQQLAPIPLLYDGEGRMYLPPKEKPTPNYQGVTLREILGRSPDDADALVLAVFGMIVKAHRPVVKAC